MIGVATLFDSNGIKLVDSNVLLINTPRGQVNVPKDFISDAFRVVEAVEEKCPLVKGMVSLPKMRGDTVLNSLESNWIFKDLWDRRTIRDTVALWDGDFLTYADDHLDLDGDFKEINIEPIEHYHNICLTIAEAELFIQSNPAFTVVGCEKSCMQETHVHAVHGRYNGAELVRNGETVWCCAPPLRLHPIWEKVFIKIPTIPSDVAPGVPHLSKYFVHAGDCARATCSGNDIVPGTWEGAQVLKKFVENPATTWSQVLVAFNDPVMASWASPSGCHKLTCWDYSSVDIVYNRIIEMLKKGAQLAKVLEIIWGADKLQDDKLVQRDLMKRLMDRGFEIYPFRKNNEEWVTICDL